MRNGYLVELKKKEGFFEPYGELQKVLMSNKKLAELLTKSCYYIISAKNVDIIEYQSNADEKLEEWGFE